jgi:hypothetical protein
LLDSKPRAWEGTRRRAYNETRDLARSHAFSALAVEGNVYISEDVVDQLIHSWFFESTRFSRLRCEFTGTFDLFCKEFRNVDTSVFSTEHSSWDTSAFDLFASVLCRVRVESNGVTSRAVVQTAVERFLSPDPKLKSARLVRDIAGECDLRRSTGEHVENFAI